jgi:hypothetical protein
MPAFLGSGGRPNRNGETEQLYRRTPEAVNKNWSGGLSLAMELLPLPEQFEAPALRAGDFDRVSVAYGLSWPSVGRILRPHEIPPLPAAQPTDYRSRFVDKDVV